MLCAHCVALYARTSFTSNECANKTAESCLFLASKANFSRTENVRSIRRSKCVCMCRRQYVCSLLLVLVLHVTQDEFVGFYWKRMFLHRFIGPLRSKFHSISRKYVHFFLYLHPRLLSVFLSFAVARVIFTAFKWWFNENLRALFFLSLCLCHFFAEWI